MTMVDTNIGKNLRKIREELGLDILDVSIETGYSESHLAQIERNKRRPSLECMIDLMDYYDCTPNELFGVEGEHTYIDELCELYSTKLNKLPAKDRRKAIRSMDAVLLAFEEVD